MKVEVELRLLSMDDKLEIELKEGSTVQSLLENLISIYGENLKKLIGRAEKGFRVIVVANREIAKFDQELKDKDELLLLLPVAGG
jgi:molybdopterin converting factor small subunit